MVYADGGRSVGTPFHLQKGHFFQDRPPTGPEGRDIVTPMALTLALSLANSSASLPFFLALEETDAAFPSILSACLVFFFKSTRSLSLTTPAFLPSAAWSLGCGNCRFIPANPREAVSGGWPLP